MGALTDLMDDVRSRPEYQAAREAARARYKRAVRRRCGFGNCTVLIDPADNTVIGGFGAVGCACESLPGWDSKHPEGRPKPGWKGKARGRNGSRIQRSRRRHAGVGPDGIMLWAHRIFDNEN